MISMPSLISVLFIIITFLTLFAFYLASGKNKLLIFSILLLAGIQGYLANSGFFLVTDTTPPRLALIVAPAILMIILTFSLKAGRNFIRKLDLEIYTYLHSVRLAVELVLFSLCQLKFIPVSMTFEGRNFDILAGISAPVIAYLVFAQGRANRKLLLYWNFVALFLVLQVVVTGIFSAPSVWQRWSFDQPNIAVLYFPFVWLPGIIVPIVIFGHLSAISRLFSGTGTLKGSH